ncbi:anthranilate phosphoribosyltransferase [Sphingomonas nostoxanthinifaciens]|uniref:anthranilate phosphoribosyltransferase n=1 Tax=Sphingomonas nostoxanthinifaciens TaxID=2872652 RepID=UPI001CC1DAFB|nr:anthranilate phosphoribosyltransferase [Sphingomonas nostoxanthinifaciens]UAK25323.1 anthranilate phosphoribosyltransferase [Sphingomonas nostoxanthinifaciens]
MTTLALLPDPAEPLEHATAEQAFADILDGKVADDDVAAFLTAMTLRDETSVEIAAAARALRARMIEVEAPVGAIDVCGTGGDGAHSLNISTAVAIVVAACGVPVAKHGNRAASSKAGAADTLEALGLDLDRAAARAEASLADLGIAFLFAQTHHPALGRLAPIRRAIGRRTIFNIVGPLANPARVTRQLVGVARVDYLSTVAEALDLLGSEAALVVSGEESLDELSIAGPSRAVPVGLCGIGGAITPEDAGLPRHGLDAIRGGDASYNAAALRALLRGAPGAYRDAVLLNAGAALIVAGTAATLEEGVEEAAEAIDKGLANALLDCWISF